jgi:hypothetical protein
MEIIWSIRFWDMYADYYYAEHAPSEWALIAAKRYQDTNKWYGL